MKNVNVKTKTGCMILMLILFSLGQLFAASCGDVDSNGEIDVIDALLTAQYYVSLNPANFDSSVADVNADGEINIVDALRMAQYYVGLVAELSCGTTNQDPIWSGGPYTLNGTSDFVDLPDGLTNNLGDFTIACWVNLSSLDTWTRVFDFGVSTDVFMMFTPASGDTGNPYFAITTSGNPGEQGINGTSTFPTGSWQHIAVVKAGNIGILYINTQEVGRNTSMTLTPADLGNTTNNFIGRSQWSNDAYLNATIDNFVVYDIALSASDVAALGSNPPQDITPGPTTPGTPEPTPTPTGGTMINGNQVIVIGESFIAMSHEITKNLEQLARSAGILPSNESFIDNSVSGTRLSGGISPTIPQQYANGNTQKTVRWVIMDGGGNDCLQGSCSSPPNSSCADLQNATTAARNLLNQMGTDGVIKVLYFFYPEPIGTSYDALKAKLDVLRPMIQNVVNSTTNPTCYWLDLRPVWNGHPEYTYDGIHPTSAGSQATANAIWEVIQQNNFF